MKLTNTIMLKIKEWEEHPKYGKLIAKKLKLFTDIMEINVIS